MVADKFISKAKQDLETIMYKSDELESTSREIVNKKTKSRL